MNGPPGAEHDALAFPRDRDKSRPPCLILIEQETFITVFMRSAWRQQCDGGRRKKPRKKPVCTRYTYTLSVNTPHRLGVGRGDDGLCRKIIITIRFKKEQKRRGSDTLSRDDYGKMYRINKPLYIVFVDFEEAFDNVSRKKVFNILKLINIKIEESSIRYIWMRKLYQ